MFMLLADTLRPLINLVLAKTWLDTDKLPRESGFIVCANHYTEIDPVIVGHMLYNKGFPPHFLAKASLFKVPLFGKMLSGSEQIPVDRNGPLARGSLEVGRKVLDDGGAIVIYPEGTLTRDPDLWPMHGHTGAARLALATGAPIIPVAHWGAQEALPRYARMVHLFPRKRVTVQVGDPVDLSDFLDRERDKELYEEATERIMAALTAMVAHLRGEEPPATRWVPAEHGQAVTGRDLGVPESEAAAAEPEQPEPEQPDTGHTPGGAR